MADRDEEVKLQARLASLPVLAQRGLAVALGASGGVAISYRGHIRGVWRAHGGSFLYTPAGYSIPTERATSLETAIRITLTLV